jgi:glutathione synthase/RimK-type ligase-like ATP-grasp enzyme
MATVGVLCARGRVEEKAIVAALAEAGVVSALFPPVDEPLPIGAPSVVAGGAPFPVPQLVIDRHPNRVVARPVLATCRARGVPALSAGIAATGDRLDVASALAAAGLPRPRTALFTSEPAALAAVAALDLPCTLLPLDLQRPGIALLDLDAAEAVLEHRAVLGGADGALGLIQAGNPAAERRATVVVVDGAAVAVSAMPGAVVPEIALRQAEDAARALCADLIAVDVALEAAGPVVWDIQPVPEFRHALPLGEQSVAEAIARAAARRLAAPVAVEIAVLPDSGLFATETRERMRGDVVFSA